MSARLELGVVAMREELMPGVWLLRLHSPQVAAEGQPGQFVHIHCSESTDPLLRRPFSFAGIDRVAGTYDIIFNVVGTGTAMLAAAEAGQHFEALGPLGHPFSFPERGTVLAVAGGLGVAPFPLVAQAALERGLRFVWMNGAYTAHQLLPLDLLPRGIEAHLATDDGTAGHHGFVTELLQESIKDWIDVEMVHACGPTPMLSALAALLQQLSDSGSGIPACDVSLEAPMGCALGTCLGCVVPSSGRLPAGAGGRALTQGPPGYVRVCVEGAVMDWRMVDWPRYRALGELVHHRTAPERLSADAVVAP